MALNQKAKLIKKGEARPKEKPRREVLADERATLIKQLKRIEREMQTA